MHLSEAGIANRTWWEERGYFLPEFNRTEVLERTSKNPRWIHFGGGNIFRAFLAEISQQLLDQGKTDTGVIVASGQGSVLQVYRPADNLCISVKLKDDETIEKRVIGCIAESRVMDSAGEDWKRLKEIFSLKSLQMASFTITEKAYKLIGPDGEYYKEVLADLQNGPHTPQSYMGMVAALCLERYRKGAWPMALVSMDNYSHNGDQLHHSIHTFAEIWEKEGKADRGFVDYVDNQKKLSFPWTMIDKITPGPNTFVKELLKKDGLENIEPFETERKTNTAIFVNAEETGYLVIEDSFPNGRPLLEEAGVIFASREMVDKVERMKVCTCLNPLHSTLAIFGCLLGYRYIWKEMRDPELSVFVREMGYKEELPVAEDPGILNPKEFMDTVLDKRFSNPFVPDSPQRIAIDLSQKIPIRFGRVLQIYANRTDRKIEKLKYIPFVLAGYLRYLMGVDDAGEEMAVSEDPRREELQSYLKEVRLGDLKVPKSILREILSKKEIFGVDLCEEGLAEIIIPNFTKMIQGPGAVRKALKEIIKTGGEEARWKENEESMRS